MSDTRLRWQVVALFDGTRVKVPATPYCDCVRQGHGFVKRDDGVWVRPCCMRRAKEAYLRHGDKPLTLEPEIAAALRAARREREEEMVRQVRQRQLDRAIDRSF